MSNLKHFYIFVIYLILLLHSCVEPEFEEVGMKPIYLSYDNFDDIKTLPPKVFENIGKIVNVGNYIFINEIDKGIHVIDNKIPSKPITLFFWEIKGNTEFTINGDVLYANHGRNLFVIDIDDFSNIKYLTSIKNVYEIETSKKEIFPDNYSGWFECYNSDKGFLIGWEKVTLKNPNCKTKI